MVDRVKERKAYALIVQSWDYEYNDNDSINKWQRCQFGLLIMNLLEITTTPIESQHFIGRPNPGTTSSREK
jgi:hypothetical protein